MNTDIRPMTVASISAGDLTILDPGLRLLAQLIDERLAYMKDVAAFKWVKQLPIEDSERERIVIQSSMEDAQTFLLDPGSSRPFIEAQIDLAKTIQRFWFDMWRQNGFDHPDFRDLSSDIRPALLDLGNKIQRATQNLAPWRITPPMRRHGKPLFTRGVNTAGLSTKDKLTLYRAWIQILPAREPLVDEADRLKY